MAGSNTSSSYRGLFSRNHGRLLLSANCSRNSKSVGWKRVNFSMAVCSDRFGYFPSPGGERGKAGSTRGGRVSLDLFPHRAIGPQTLEVIDHLLIERMVRPRWPSRPPAAASAAPGSWPRSSAARRPGSRSRPGVGPDQRDDHRLFFAALKTIDAVDLQARLGQLFAAAAALGPHRAKSRRCPPAATPGLRCRARTLRPHQLAPPAGSSGSRRRARVCSS